MATQELVYRLRVQSDGTVAIDRMAQSFGAAKAAAQTMSTAVTGVRGQLLTLAATAQTVQVAWRLVGGAVRTAFTDVLAEAERLQGLSRQFQVPAEALSGLSFAAKQAGVDIGALGFAFKSLSANLVEGLKPGTDAFQLLQTNLGFTAEQLVAFQRDPVQAVLALADAFNRFEDGAEKAVAGQQLFGRGFFPMLKLFKEGRTELEQNIALARQYGAVFSDSLVSAGDRAGDALARLKLAFEGIRTQTIGNPEVLNLFAGAIERLSDGIAALRPRVVALFGPQFEAAIAAMSAGIDHALSALEDQQVLDDLVRRLHDVTQAVHGLTAILGPLGSLLGVAASGWADFLRAVSIGESTLNKIVEVLDQAADAQARWNGAVASARPEDVAQVASESLRARGIVRSGDRITGAIGAGPALQQGVQPGFTGFFDPLHPPADQQGPLPGLGTPARPTGAGILARPADAAARTGLATGLGDGANKADTLARKLADLRTQISAATGELSTFDARVAEVLASFGEDAKGHTEEITKLAQQLVSVQIEEETFIKTIGQEIENLGKPTAATLSALEDIRSRLQTRPQTEGVTKELEQVEAKIRSTTQAMHDAGVALEEDLTNRLVDMLGPAAKAALEFERLRKAAHEAGREDLVPIIDQLEHMTSVLGVLDGVFDTLGNTIEDTFEGLILGTRTSKDLVDSLKASLVKLAAQLVATGLENAVRSVVLESLGLDTSGLRGTQSGPTVAGGGGGDDIVGAIFKGFGSVTTLLGGGGAPAAAPAATAPAGSDSLLTGLLRSALRPSTTASVPGTSPAGTVGGPTGAGTTPQGGFNFSVGDLSGGIGQSVGKVLGISPETVTTLTQGIGAIASTAGLIYGAMQLFTGKRAQDKLLGGFSTLLSGFSLSQNALVQSLAQSVGTAVGLVAPQTAAAVSGLAPQTTNLFTGAAEQVIPLVAQAAPAVGEGTVLAAEAGNAAASGSSALAGGASILSVLGGLTTIALGTQAALKSGKAIQEASLGQGQAAARVKGTSIATSVAGGLAAAFGGPIGIAVAVLMQFVNSAVTNAVLKGIKDARKQGLSQAQLEQAIVEHQGPLLKSQSLLATGFIPGADQIVGNLFGGLLAPNIETILEKTFAQQAGQLGGVPLNRQLEDFPGQGLTRVGRETLKGLEGLGPRAQAVARFFAGLVGAGAENEDRVRRFTNILLNNFAALGKTTAEVDRIFERMVRNVAGGDVLSTVQTVRTVLPGRAFDRPRATLQNIAARAFAPELPGVDTDALVAEFAQRPFVNATPKQRRKSRRREAEAPAALFAADTAEAGVVAFGAQLTQVMADAITKGLAKGLLSGPAGDILVAFGKGLQRQMRRLFDDGGLSRREERRLTNAVERRGDRAARVLETLTPALVRIAEIQQRETLRLQVRTALATGQPQAARDTIEAQLTPFQRVADGFTQLGRDLKSRVTLATKGPGFEAEATVVAQLKENAATAREKLDSFLGTGTAQQTGNQEKLLDLTRTFIDLNLSALEKEIDLARRRKTFYEQLTQFATSTREGTDVIRRGRAAQFDLLAKRQGEIGTALATFKTGTETERAESLTKIQRLIPELVTLGQTLLAPGSQDLSALLDFVDAVAAQIGGAGEAGLASANADIKTTTATLQAMLAQWGPSITGFEQSAQAILSAEFAKVVEALSGTTGIKPILQSIAAQLGVKNPPKDAQTLPPGTSDIDYDALAAVFGRAVADAILKARGETPPARALGGPVRGATSYVVGEKGPELFVPHAAMTAATRQGPRRRDVPRLVGRRGTELFVPPMAGTILTAARTAQVLRTVGVSRGGAALPSAVRAPAGSARRAERPVQAAVERSVRSGPSPAVLERVVGLAGHRASGGPVQSARLYLVGERGPELFVPAGHGTVAERVRRHVGPRAGRLVTGALTPKRLSDLLAVPPTRALTVVAAPARQLGTLGDGPVAPRLPRTGVPRLARQTASRAADGPARAVRLVGRMGAEVFTPPTAGTIVPAGPTARLLRQAVAPRRTLPRRESGGPVQAGASYVVGERGAELYIPRGRPSERSGGVTVRVAPTTVNVTIQATGGPVGSAVTADVTAQITAALRRRDAALVTEIRRAVGQR